LAKLESNDHGPSSQFPSDDFVDDHYSQQISDPILDPMSPQIACNDDGTSGALQLTANVKAGSAITAYWNQVWPHPFGPMVRFSFIRMFLFFLTPLKLTYLALCPGATCTGVNAATLKWVGNMPLSYRILSYHGLQFKIDQSGLINGTVFAGYWGSGKMIDQNSSWTTTIPATVPNGNYLLRFETIALHSLPAVRNMLHYIRLILTRASDSNSIPNVPR
jgi:hypothetical protein